MQSALLSEAPSEKFCGWQFISSIFFRLEEDVKMFSHATSVLPPFAKIKHDGCKPLERNLKKKLSHAACTYL
jgi:hypothetical protein